MCFGKKKSASSPTKLVISSPIPIPFDYEKNAPLPTSSKKHSPHISAPIPIPSPQSFSSQYSYTSTPEPVPVPHWRQPANPKQPEKKESRKWLSKTNTSQISTRPAVTVPLVGKLKGSMFRNAGLDEHGRLKIDYEALGEADWGTPEGYRRPSVW